MNAKAKAFPDPHIKDMGGMTLRQYYAAAALPECMREMREGNSYLLSDAANLAFAYADAMIRHEAEES